MTPARFPEANRNLTKPASWAPPEDDLPVPDGWMERECGDLPVYTNGEHCLSCWGLTWRERLRVLFSGHIWLWVWSGHTQPPVALSAESPFTPRAEGWQ